MKNNLKEELVVLTVCAFVGISGAAAQNFNFARHHATAQAAIAKVSGDLGGMDTIMPRQELNAIHGLLDNAKKRLDAAKSLEHGASSPRDHALAIAKAGAAKSYADAADILHFEFMRLQSQGRAGKTKRQHPSGHGAMQQNQEDRQQPHGSMQMKSMQMK
jgi:hypothetical protein